MLILVLFYLRLDLHNSLVTDTSNKKTRLSSLKQVNSKLSAHSFRMIVTILKNIL